MYVPRELRVLQTQPGSVVVEVLGEHDLESYDETLQLFARLIGEYSLVIIDLTETQFMDSSFLKNLKNAQRVADELGHRVVLQVGTEPIVRRMLEITHFLDHFDYVSSRDEAFAWAPA